jgi:hypothetical protein
VLRPFRQVDPTQWIWLCYATAIVIAMIASDQAQANSARPYRGPVAWSIVLCTLSDSSAPPHDPAYYRDLIANRGTGGLSDFLATVSYGNSDLTPTVVKGWYAMPFTQAQEEALGGGGS